MFVKRALTTGLTAAMLGLPLLAGAQTFEGTLDGKAHTWHVLQQGGASSVTISEVMPGMQAVSIEGYAQPRHAVKGTMSVSVTLLRGKLVTAPEVTYFSESKLLPNYSSVDSQPVKYSFKLEDPSDAGARAVGWVKGKLYRNERIGQDPNMQDSITVDVKFDLRATKTP